MNTRETQPIQEFTVQQEIEDKWEWQKHTFYFRDYKGHILAYAKVNVQQFERESVAYLIDITNATGFPYMSEKMQELYTRNGYNPTFARPKFGETVLSYLIESLKSQYKNLRLVSICSLPQNEDAVWDLVNRVQESSLDLISRVSGGGESTICTLFIN